MATDHRDDPSIPDEERLFRRIHLAHVVEAEGGTCKVSSAAFRDVELSVNLEGIMRAAGRAPKDSLRDNPRDLLVSICAGVCRHNGQLVGPDPLPSEPAHGYVFGKKTKSIQRALRDSAGWVVPETTPCWEEIRLLRWQLGVDGRDPEAE